MIRLLRELIQRNWDKPMQEQKQIFDSAISSWIGSHEQTDDITLIGIRF